MSKCYLEHIYEFTILNTNNNLFLLSPTVTLSKSINSAWFLTNYLKQNNAFLLNCKKMEEQEISTVSDNVYEWGRLCMRQFEILFVNSLSFSLITISLNTKYILLSLFCFCSILSLLKSQYSVCFLVAARILAEYV